MDVQVNLARIIISDTSDQQVIVLKEMEGERQFPIVIGSYEAWAIDRRLKGFQHPRPLTHDLMASIIEDLHGDLERIVVSDLRQGTFFAKLIIRLDGELVEVDARPSDAIALGVAMETPIFVAEHVLRDVTS